MGLETKTIARSGKSEVAGRLHLDSKQIEFSSRELKWKATLGASLNAEQV